MKKLTLLLLFSASALHAQKYLGEAAIPGVSADGFYHLQLSAEWVPYLNDDLSNIRIFDTNDQEVPYLYQQEVPVSFTQQFKPYEIMEKKQEKNCCTSILLRNPDAEPINNISLSIKNAEVTKNATLLGSDDKENWYALKQHFVLSSIDGNNNTSEIKIVDFPRSNYGYYLLQIEDSTSAPINILSAGYYEVNSESGAYTGIASRFHQVDSASLKSTFVFLKFGDHQIIDKIDLKVSGSPYFLRQASLHQKTSRLNNKGDTIYYYQRLFDFTITSRQSTVLELRAVRTDEILIVIENEDNPPLKAEQVIAWQLNRYFTAWLKAGENYTVKIGEKAMAAPVYDLTYFRESINSKLPAINAKRLIVAAGDRPQAASTFFTDRNIIWVAIIFVVAIFGVMAVRMTREMGKENK